VRHADSGDPSWSQVPRCDGSGRRRPHIGEVSLVQQYRFGPAGTFAEKQHQPVARREPERGITIESGSHFDNKRVVGIDMSEFDMAIAGRLFEVKVACRRDHQPPLGKRGEALLLAVDEPRRIQGGPDLFQCINPGFPAHAQGSWD
jgi:hypothetical protein